MSVRNVTSTAGAPGGIESYQDKFIRKFKEQPLVPIGAAATCVALVAALVKSRRGDSKSMNYWLRARVVAQGLTIAAIVGGSYAYGQTKQQKEAAAAKEQDNLLANAAKERAEFQQRLSAAEEAHRLEEEMAKGGRGSVSVARSSEPASQSGKGWRGWFDGGAAEDTPPQPPKTNEPLPPPSGVSSAPAGAEMVRTPVADAPASTSSSKGFWERLGWGRSSSSEKKS